MPTSPVQRIFVYGTLMSDQPEHLRFEVKAQTITPASVPGRLYRLQEGYPLLVAPSECRLLEASSDPLADWTKAEQLTLPPLDADSAPRIEGELLEIPLHPVALRSMDEWEGFEPGRLSIYQRAIVPAQAEGRALPAWAYVSSDPPASAEPLDVRRWNRSLLG